nr:hypothetical protein [Tanacetum cinerariifolium]
PSSPKHVYFINSIIILNKKDEAKEGGSVKSSVTENKDYEMTVESEEEFEEETKEETEEEEEERRLSSLRTQLGQQQDDMISKINLLWKAIFEKLDDMPIRNTAGNLTAQMNFIPSSPKHVYFINSIIILNKKDEAKEGGSVKSSVTENKDYEMTVESEEEFEEETKEETEEEEEGNPKHFDTFPTMKELEYHE